LREATSKMMEGLKNRETSPASAGGVQTKTVKDYEHSAGAGATVPEAHPHD